MIYFVLLELNIWVALQLMTNFFLLLVCCIFANTWLAKSSDISELSFLSLKIALMSCNIGVIPVPPAIIPNFLAITVSGAAFISGLTWNTPIKNEIILIKLLKSLQNV